MGKKNRNKGGKRNRYDDMFDYGGGDDYGYDGYDSQEDDENYQYSYQDEIDSAEFVSTDNNKREIEVEEEEEEDEYVEQDFRSQTNTQYRSVENHSIEKHAVEKHTVEKQSGTEQKKSTVAEERDAWDFVQKQAQGNDKKETKTTEKVESKKDLVSENTETDTEVAESEAKPKGPGIAERVKTLVQGMMAKLSQMKKQKAESSEEETSEEKAEETQTKQDSGKVAEVSETSEGENAESVEDKPKGPGLWEKVRSSLTNLLSLMKKKSSADEQKTENAEHADGEIAENSTKSETNLEKNVEEKKEETSVVIPGIPEKTPEEIARENRKTYLIVGSVTVAIVALLMIAGVLLLVSNSGKQVADNENTENPANTEEVNHSETNITETQELVPPSLIEDSSVKETVEIPKESKTEEKTATSMDSSLIPDSSLDMTNLEADLEADLSAIEVGNTQMEPTETKEGESENSETETSDVKNSELPNTETDTLNLDSLGLDSTLEIDSATITPEASEETPSETPSETPAEMSTETVDGGDIQDLLGDSLNSDLLSAPKSGSAQEAEPSEEVTPEALISDTKAETEKGETAEVAVELPTDLSGDLVADLETEIAKEAETKADGLSESKMSELNSSNSEINVDSLVTPEMETASKNEEVSETADAVENPLAGMELIGTETKEENLLNPAPIADSLSLEAETKTETDTSSELESGMGINLEAESKTEKESSVDFDSLSIAPEDGSLAAPKVGELEENSETAPNLGDLGDSTSLGDLGGLETSQTTPSTQFSGSSASKESVGKKKKEEEYVESSDCINHAVVRDDTYWKISEKYYGTPAYKEALARYNNDVVPDANNLKVGTLLQVPKLEFLRSCYPTLCPQSVQVAPKQVSGSGEVLQVQYYCVAEGDTLSVVAERLLGDASRWPEIYRLNIEKVSNLDMLPVGEKLLIPVDQAIPESRIWQ